MTPRPLRTVGHFDLIKVIGRGGAATVYMAHQTDLGREVALKQLDPFEADDPTFAARFARESHLAGSLSHPNIVTVHEYFEHEGVPYIAMEYLPRGSLRRYVGGLPIAQVAGVIEDVLAGLSYGQTRGLVHRDLKPENLLVTSDGRIKIADFGIARSFDGAISQVGLTAAGTTIGTPAYMAPEQAEGGKLGPATDLYSLGIIAWELLTGRVPFDDPAAPLAVLYRQVHEPVPSARSVNPEIDADLDRWLARMLEKRPEDRFPSAGAAWEALEDVVLGLLGPRWRREARLQGDPARRDPREPEQVDDPDAPAPPPPDPLGPEEVDDPGRPPPTPAGGNERQRASTEDAPVVEHATVAPRGKPASSRSTLLRIARRHKAEDPHADPVGRSYPRRALLLTALALTATAAAVAGVVAGSPGRAPARRASVASKSAAARAAQARMLLAVLQTVDSARGRGFTALAAARTAPRQAAAAEAVGNAYGAGVQQIDRLGVTVRDGAMAGSLRSIFATLAADYGALSRAAAAENRAGYASATTSIGTAEQQLRAASEALAKAS